MHCVAVCCSVLQCFAVYCNVLQRVAVFSMRVCVCALQYVVCVCTLVCKTSCFQGEVHKNSSQPALLWIYNTCRSVLQCVVVCCSVLQCVAVYCNVFESVRRRHASNTFNGCLDNILPTRCNTLHHTAMHCNTLQHTASHCINLQYTATYCNTLQHTATHSRCTSCRVNGISKMCNTLQHTATHCNTQKCTAAHWIHCNTLQNAITHCNTLQCLLNANNVMSGEFHKSN